MRHPAWVIVPLLAACAADPVGLSTDAAPDDDEALPDARPRADARERGDAAPGTPDAGPDAAPGSPDAQILAFRPYSGPRARLRVIDAHFKASGAGIKVCLFGDDDDPRPYAAVRVANVVSVPGFESPVKATYVEVPALANLRASVHPRYDLDTVVIDSTADGCDGRDALHLRGEGGLIAGAHYTAVNISPSASSARCERSEEDGCQFYPMYGAGVAATQCAESGLRTFRDGHLGTGGYRVVNLTNDAALLSHSPSLGVEVELRHTDLPFSFAESYEATIPGDTTYLCPAYARCTGADLDVNPFTECTQGNPAWMLGTIESSRIARRDRFTSFYVVGEARELAANGSGLTGVNPKVITAHDVAD